MSILFSLHVSVPAHVLAGGLRACSGPRVPVQAGLPFEGVPLLAFEEVKPEPTLMIKPLDRKCVMWLLSIVQKQS
jgi:hypothetical protein